MAVPALLNIVKDQSPPPAPIGAGWSAAYHPGRVNSCPECGQSQWLVGRHSAQCALCATAVPFAAGLAARGAHRWQ